MAELTYRDAVAAGIAQEMERDPRVVFLGEDVAAAGGVFNTIVPAGAIEPMTMGNNQAAIYDVGFYNIGVRPTAEDLSRGETAPNVPQFQNPKDGQKPFPLSYSRLAQLKYLNRLPADLAHFVPTSRTGSG